MLGLKMNTAYRNVSSISFQKEYDPSDFIDRVRVMKRQEETVYICRDYLRQSQTSEDKQYTCKRYVYTPQSLYNATNAGTKRGPVEVLSNRKQGYSKNNTIDELCREQMCEWSYRVADHFHIPREIVSISMSYLDRFLSTNGCDRSAFKLVAMTTLFMATKIHGANGEMISLSSIAEMSRGEFGEEHLTQMEEIILVALNWRMHTPTSISFMQQMCALLPVSIKSLPIVHVMLNRAYFFSELAVYDYAFVTYKPSSIAFAALYNAIEGITLRDISTEQRSSFFKNVACHFGICRNVYSIEVESARDRLWEVYKQSEQYKKHDMMNRKKSTTNRSRVLKKKGSDGNMSPTCVSRAAKTSRQRRTSTRFATC